MISPKDLNNDSRGRSPWLSSMPSFKAEGLEFWAMIEWG